MQIFLFLYNSWKSAMVSYRDGNPSSGKQLIKTWHNTLSTILGAYDAASLFVVTRCANSAPGTACFQPTEIVWLGRSVNGHRLRFHGVVQGTTDTPPETVPRLSM
jgi:hypothetical protein